MKLTTADILKALREGKSSRLATEGFTAQEFKEALGINCARPLTALFREGKVKYTGEREATRINGTKYSVPVYRMVEEAV